MISNIIIADDHAMIRKGIRLLLMSRLGYKDVFEAGSCSEVMNELKKGGCSHLILDVVFSDGTSLEIVPAIKRLYPDVKIMIFSMQSDEIYSEAFRQYDIQYYLNKSAKEEEAVNFIKRFLNDETNRPDNSSSSEYVNPISLLTVRELEVLHYLVKGYKTKDIAKSLNLGNSTISTFKNRIFEKTGTSNIAQLIELASIHMLSTNENNQDSTP